MHNLCNTIRTSYAKQYVIFRNKYLVVLHAANEQKSAQM